MGISAALMCLALNIYNEARGEVLGGQQAVALVTMNRAGWEPKRVCEEVHRPGQFSWTTSKRGPPKEKEAWGLALEVARDVMNRRVPDFTDGATFFHAKRVRPKWRHTEQYVMTLGSHLFYKSSSK